MHFDSLRMSRLAIQTSASPHSLLLLNRGPSTRSPPSITADLKLEAQCQILCSSFLDRATHFPDACIKQTPGARRSDNPYIARYCGHAIPASWNFSSERLLLLFGAQCRRRNWKKSLVSGYSIPMSTVQPVLVHVLCHCTFPSSSSSKFSH